MAWMRPNASWFGSLDLQNRLNVQPVLAMFAELSDRAFSPVDEVENHPKLSSPHFEKPRTPLSALNKECSPLSQIPVKVPAKASSTPQATAAVAELRKIIHSSSAALQDTKTEWKKRNECFAEIQSSLANMPAGVKISQEDIQELLFPLVVCNYKSLFCCRVVG
jgi:hypothetical protein